MSSNDEPRSTANERPPVTHLPVSSVRRLRRRAVFGPLSDPVVQGVVAVMSAALFATAAWGLRSNGLVALGALAIAVALGSAAAFLLLVGRAMQRDKLIEYWQDRRALRLELRRSRANTALLARTLRRISEWDHLDEPPDVMPALIHLVDDVQEALAARHDDIAVVLVLEADERFTLLHTAAPTGSRFGLTRWGKTTSAAIRSFAEKIQAEAPHHHTFSADVEQGVLHLGVLSELDFDDDDNLLSEHVPTCFNLLAARLQPLVSRTVVQLHPSG